MIICPNPHPDYPDDWIMVKQSDHDDHCGYIATHWTSEQFWQPTDVRLSALAVAMHDTGSANWEDHPTINSMGIPWSYWTMPADDHIELHRHGVAVAREIDPYVALLISMHTVGIHRDRLHVDTQPNRWHIPEHFTAKVNTFVEEQTALQQQLHAEVESQRGKPLPREQLMDDFRIFGVIDILSTQFPACGLAAREMVWVPDRQGKPATINVTRAGEWEMKIEPFVFDGDRFEVPIPARHIPRRVFRSNDEYREAWYTARPITLPYAFVRG